MIAGHYAAALAPAAHRVPAPFWLLLLCAQIPEFFWLALALAGVEPAWPASLLDATFANLQVDMRYSHNLVPALMQAALTAAVVAVFYRRLSVVLWCAGLVVVHVLCDYVVGFSHQVWWYASTEIALNSYRTMPYVAVLIELAFALGCIYYFQRVRARTAPVPRRQLIALYAVFVIGILAWMPAARVPLRVWLGL